MEFIKQIFINAPIWVWPLFILLLTLGIRSAKTRSMPIWPYYFLPLMVLLSVNSLRSQDNFTFAIPVFLASVAAGASIGFFLQKRWVIMRETNKVQVCGEWFTLFVMLAIFLLNFLGGILRAVAPHIIANSIWSLALLSALTIMSATFLGRSIRILTTPIHTSQSS